MTQPQKKKVIGVIGGIGPEASANLYLKMIHYMQARYHAVQDADYPPMIIYNVPMEGFNENGIVDGDAVKRQLIETGQKLEKAGAEVLIIACNTVHVYYDELQAALSIPVFNIVEETGLAVQKAELETIGLLCSQSTNDLCLYNSKYLGNTKIMTCSQEEQNDVNKVIESVMAGKHGLSEIITLKNIIINMTNKGAKGVILGCTELPLAINQSHTDIMLFDSLNIIIKSAVDYSLGLRS